MRVLNERDGEARDSQPRQNRRRASAGSGQPLPGLALVLFLLMPITVWADAVDEASPPLPRVHVIATGGTIAGAGYAGVEEKDSEELLLGVPELSKIAQVTAEDPYTIGSSQITPTMLFDMALDIRKMLAEDPGLAGVIVTQGTDSMEEAAFLLDLVIDDPRPVIFTGAMRQPGQMAAEGGRNLLNAVRLAVSPASRGMGVLVTMNDEIHAAREIRKLHSSSVGAFVSPAGGRLGFLDGDEIFMLNSPRRRLTIPTKAIEPKVDLVVVTAGSDGHLLASAIDSGVKGLVIELFGRGNMTRAMIPQIARALQSGIKVVFASRTHNGGLREDQQWMQGGVIYAQDLGGIKARIALMVALGAGIHDSEGLQEVFDKLAGKL